MTIWGWGWFTLSRCPPVTAGERSPISSVNLLFAFVLDFAMGNKKSAPQSQQFSGLVLVNNATSDSPEYRTLTQCYPTLVTCLQQSPNDIADRLRPFGIFAHEDWLFLTHESKDRDQKARRIIDVVILQVKLNPQVAHTFRLALEGAGTWTKAAVSELETTYNSFTKGTQSQPLQACSISDETQSPESIDGSICAQIHSRAFSHHSQPTSDNFQLDKDNSTDDCDTSSGEYIRLRSNFWWSCLKIGPGTHALHVYASDDL